MNILNHSEIVVDIMEHWGTDPSDWGIEVFTSLIGVLGYWLQWLGYWGADLSDWCVGVDVIDWGIGVLTPNDWVLGYLPQWLEYWGRGTYLGDWGIRLQRGPEPGEDKVGSSNCLTVDHSRFPDYLVCKCGCLFCNVQQLGNILAVEYRKYILSSWRSNVVWTGQCWHIVNQSEQTPLQLHVWCRLCYSTHGLNFPL